VSDLGECCFNWRKCLWETFPEHWVNSDNPAAWIVVAFPSATALQRGIPDPLRTWREHLLAMAQAYHDSEPDGGDPEDES
jgi:hypothetical protein